jgi:ubiquinone/menaquinone biosynthesis C-methylase UbiE/uncharacterized protein YbaR (Trm112 family)
MQNTVIYACPTCRTRLENSSEVLSCKTCQTAYPIVDGIPDFVSEDATLDTSPHLNWANKNYNLQARIYEKSRYPWRLFLYGEFGAPSFKELVRFTSEIVDIDKGQILDAACGPGTLGRRIASQSKTVYGIDISWAMLHQGAAYVKRSHIANFHLARAKAENLPFEDARFDAALCGSALHFFADPVSTLCEIGRTMKEGAPLAVVTLLEKNNKRSLFRRFRDRLLQPPSAHLFKVPELEQITAKAGFEDFQPQVYGSMILFSVRKRRKKGA